MHFHFCGDPLHWIPCNLLVLWNAFPELLPMLVALKRRLHVALLRRVHRH